MYPMPLFKYPYSDYSILNLDWVIERIQEMYSIMDQKINEAIAPINTQITAINADLTTIHVDISNLNGRMHRAEGDISSLYHDINVINDRISGIEGNVNTLTTDIEDIGIDINFLRGEVSLHTEEIADIYNKIADIDPDSGLIVDATNFNVENRTASVLDTVYQFELTGGNPDMRYEMYPDLIPGTQSGYYPRVTMQTDAITGKIKLPSELTTGDLPKIIRGTYATNVNKNAEVYSGDPLEYSINGEVFTVDGYDENAIILMCIACLHRGVNEFENVFIDNGIEVVKGIPLTSISSDYQRYEGNVSRQSLPYGLTPWAYFFDIEGNLLGYNEIPDIASTTLAIPAGTYSIWYGIQATAYHNAWTNNQFYIFIPGLAGSYYVDTNSEDNEIFITTHEVDFEYNDGQSGSFHRHIALKLNGIYGLASIDKIDMFTGDIYRNGVIMPSQKFTIWANAFRSLLPDKQYNVKLLRNGAYNDADLKYNKIMMIINGLDANNTSY